MGETASAMEGVDFTVQEHGIIAPFHKFVPCEGTQVCQPPARQFIQQEHVPPDFSPVAWRCENS